MLCFTGLSGSGKSTIAAALARRLDRLGYHAFALHGDELRRFAPEIGYSRADRARSSRLKLSYARVLFEAGVIPICAFVLASREQREHARSIFRAGEFVECYIRCPLEVCMRRDPKGLYARRQRHEISSVVGLDIPYEEPADPELVIPTDERGVEECCDQILAFLIKSGHLDGEGTPGGGSPGDGP